MVTSLEETLQPYRIAVRRRYQIVAVIAVLLAIAVATATYRATGLGPYAMAAVFVVFAIWFFVRHELKFEERFVMPDTWFASVAKTQGIRRQTLDDLKELVSSTSPATLDDVDRIARRDSEDCAIHKNAAKPGVKALLAKR